MVGIEFIHPCVFMDLFGRGGFRGSGFMVFLCSFSFSCLYSYSICICEMVVHV